MEKRFTLALVLTFAFVILWMQVIKPKFFPAPPAPPVSTDSRPVEADSRAQTSTAPTTHAESRPVVAATEAKTPSIENEHVRLEFSSVGAVITKAALKDFKTIAGSSEPLNILHAFKDRARALELRDTSDGTAWLEARNWATQVDEAGSSITFTIERGISGLDSPYRIKKKVSLPKGAYYADVTFSFEYLAASGRMEKAVRLTPTGGVSLDSDAYGTHDLTGAESALFKNDPQEGEKFAKTTPLEVGKGLKVPAGVEFIPESDLPRVTQSLNGTRRYTADLNSYFGVYCGLTDMPPKMEASFVGIVDPEATGRAKNTVSRSRVDLDFRFVGDAGKAVEHSLFLYFGPKETKRIEQRLTGTHAEWVPDFGRVYADALGMFAFVGKAVLWLLGLFHWMTGNWGVAIMLLTFAVKLLMFPVTRRSQASMLRYSEAMGKLKPRLQELQQKYKEDPKRMMMEQQKLYKEHNVPMVPLGGCLPVFLQMPIFYGLFAALRSSIDLRHAPFWWVADLSQPDHLIRFDHPFQNPLVHLPCTCCLPPGMSDTLSGLHLLPLLMTAAWFLNQFLMPKPQTEDPQMAQQRKMMMFMPLMFGFMMYSYGAGLSLYWLTSSLLGIIETRLIKRKLPAKVA